MSTTATVTISVPLRDDLYGFAEHVYLKTKCCVNCRGPVHDHRVSDGACPLRYVVACIEGQLGSALSADEVSYVREEAPNVDDAVKRIRARRSQADAG